MADLVLKCGRIVILSEEDFEWASQFSWRSWRKLPHIEPIVVHDDYANVGTGVRGFRRRLLREIAARMRPEIASITNRVKVRPINGDYFDARRENLAIRVRPVPRARPIKDPRPKGYIRKRKTGAKHVITEPRVTSALWNPTSITRKYAKRGTAPDRRAR